MAQVPFTVKRPWGEFRQFTLGESTTVKTIFIRKGGELSLQRHELRNEFWRVLSGTPEITMGVSKDVGSDLHAALKVVQAKKGDEFTVEQEIEHRISAPHDDVEILEISRGIFKEDDIVRIEDKYGRV